MKHDAELNLEILDRIYDVAVDPARLEELVDSWEEHFSPLRLLNPEWEGTGDQAFTHFSRLGLLLDRLPQDNHNDITDEAGTLAALVVSPDLIVQSANAAARELLGVCEGEKPQNLPIDEDSYAALLHGIKQALRHDGTAHFMRFRILDNERFVVVQIRALNAPNGQRNALIVTSILAWQETFGEAIKGVFDLSQSEVEIVRCMVEGHTIKSIATKRGRSEATVRTQVRSIYEKTETRSQAELVRISLSLMDMVKTTGTSDQPSYGPSDEEAVLGPNVFQSIPRPAKRWMDYTVYGDLTGAPVLYLPSDLGLIRVPAKVEALLRARGIKMIVPIRAGYGRSTPVETMVNYEETVSADFAALLDHFEVERCPILAQTSDFCFATLFAARHPERVSAIVTCAPPFPFWKREQFERMDKWYRFILANARFAPRVLPYMVKAGFFLARSIGKRGFLNAVFSNSDADKAVFANQEVFDAMALGSEVTLSHWHSAHVAFAREVTLHAGQNWGNDLAQLEGQIPVTAFIGLDGPMMPQQTFDEVQQKYPWIEYKIMPDAGELLLFKYWPEVLEYLTPFLHPKP